MKIIRIGRNSDNDVVIGDSYVSGSHYRITADDNSGFAIADSSTNGTFVNGKQIGGGCRTLWQENNIVRMDNNVLPRQAYSPYTDDKSTTPKPDAPEQKPEQKSGLGTAALVLSIIGAGLLMYSAIFLIKRGIFGWVLGGASTWAFVSFGLNIIAYILALVANYKDYKDSHVAEIAKEISGFCIIFEIGFYLYLRFIRFRSPNLMN